MVTHIVVVLVLVLVVVGGPRYDARGRLLVHDAFHIGLGDSHTSWGGPVTVTALTFCPSGCWSISMPISVWLCNRQMAHPC